MDERINRLEDKLDRMDGRLDKMAVILAKNTELLDIHIKRTDLLEDYLRDEIVARDLNPIKEHVMNVRAASRIIVWVASAAAGTLAFLIGLKQLGVF
jgi:hypothetical protein